MKITDIKRFYVQDTRDNSEIATFFSLTQAVEYLIAKADTNLLIHIGGYNLSYYLIGDTHNKLYIRCANIISRL